jgi:hypothetical protein
VLADQVHSTRGREYAAGLSEPLMKTFDNGGCRAFLTVREIRGLHAVQAENSIRSMSILETARVYQYELVGRDMESYARNHGP